MSSRSRSATCQQFAPAAVGGWVAAIARTGCGTYIAGARYHRHVVILKDSSPSLAARLFRGFADPTRVGILLALLDGERRVSDLVEAVGGSQPNVSGHLACLRECGLVVDRPGERRQVFYRLANPEVAELLLAAENLLRATGTTVSLCENPFMDQGRLGG